MKLKDFMPSILSKARFRGSQSRSVRRLQQEVEEAKILAAKSLMHQFQTLDRVDRLSDVEFKVFSQFGDDGIIQYLIKRLGVRTETFVEFGVEDYRESNTRFLLLNNNWRGLVMDGSESHVRAIRQDDAYWRHDLTAVCAFIDRDNICDLLAEHGFNGRLGILSIDLDGNDYWVWERITNVDPVIVIVEYNALFGFDRAVSIPYDASFHRTSAHASNLYWGCSLKALCSLAETKGYALVGCNGNGNNAYFVKRDQLNDLRPLTAEEGFVDSRFRESRDAQGNLTYLSGEDRIQAVREMPLVDVTNGGAVLVGDL